MINNVTLPDQARTKLNALMLQRMSAEDGTRAAAARLSNMPIDTDPELRAALEREQDPGIPSCIF